VEIGSEDKSAPLKERFSFVRKGGLGQALLGVVGFYLALIPLLAVVAGMMFWALGEPVGQVESLYLTSVPVLAAVGLITAFMVFRKCGRWIPLDGQDSCRAPQHWSRLGGPQCCIFRARRFRRGPGVDCYELDFR
jgi:hypothetical protein